MIYTNSESYTRKLRFLFPKIKIEVLKEPEPHIDLRLLNLICKDELSNYLLR